MSSSEQNQNNKKRVFETGPAGMPVGCGEPQNLVEDKRRKKKIEVKIMPAGKDNNEIMRGENIDQKIGQRKKDIQELFNVDDFEISDIIIENLGEIFAGDIEKIAKQAEKVGISERGEFINKKILEIKEKYQKIRDDKENKDNIPMSEDSEGKKIMSKKPEKLNINPEAKSEKIDMYDDMKEKDEKRLSDRCATEFKIDGKKEDHIKNILEKETDHKKLEFALKWFDENRNKSEIKNKAVSSGVEISDAKKVDIAIEAGALDELDTKGKYKKDKIELENIYTIRKDFSKQDGCPIESRFLALNILNKRMERKQAEMREQEMSEQEIYQNKEIEDLMGDMKELSKKITGLDLDEKAKKKIGSLQSEEDFISIYLDAEKEDAKQWFKIEIFQEEYKEFKVGKSIFIDKKIKEWKKFKISDDIMDKLISDFRGVKNVEDFANISLYEDTQIFNARFEKESIDEETICAFYKKGYNSKDFKKRKTWRSLFLKNDTIEISKNNRIAFKEFENSFLKVKENFNSDNLEKAEKNLASEWENKIKPAYEAKLEKEMQNQIEKIAKSPEDAVKNIQILFDRIKGRQIDEFLKESEIGKQKKTAKQIEEIKELENQDKEKIVPDIHKIIFDIVDKREEIEEMMEGNFDLKDEDNRKKFHNYFSEEMGIDYVSDENILDFAEQENAPIFGEKIKSERGWLDYVLELIFSAFNTETE